MKKVCVFFPGQGSQYVGMGQKWIENSYIAKHIFEEASDVLGFDMIKLCTEGDLDKLTKTQNAQLSIFTVGIAAFRVLMSQYEFKPEFLLGHSLGEITALTCAGAVSFQDALKIVSKRGELMSQAVTNIKGKMAAVEGMSKEEIEALCREIAEDDLTVSVSNYNAPSQYVISGDIQAVEKVEAVLGSKNIKTKALKVSAPFHCVLMQPAKKEFAQFLNDYHFHSLKYKVISNVDARLYTDKTDIGMQLANQIVSPVLWEDSMLELSKHNIELGIDIGPKAVLRKLADLNDLSMEVLAFENESDRNQLIKYKKANEGTQFLSRCLAIAVCTKNSNDNMDEYTNGVVKPYRQIKDRMLQLENQQEDASIQDMENALVMLHSVFETKKVSEAEQRLRYEQLISETGTQELLDSCLKQYLSNEK